MPKELIDDYTSQKLGIVNLSKKYKLTHSQIYYILRKKNIKRYSHQDSKRKYTLNDAIFDEIDSEEKAYFLGLLYADGCNTGKVLVLKLSEKDSEIIEKFKLFLSSNKPIRLIKNIYCTDRKGKKHKCKNAMEFSVGNIKLCEKLIEHGVVPEKN